MTMAAVALDPPPAYLHTTVMREEVVRWLEPRARGVYLDTTAGGGGHSEAILEASPGARVIASDCDPTALGACRVRLARFGGRVTFWQARFDELKERLAAAGIGALDGLVADLGVSSAQLDDPDRGFSFRLPGPLDMRLDPETGETALELIVRLDAEELANVIYQYGDERRSRRIARCIQQAEQAGELRTTLDLRRAVVRAVGPRRIGGVDPATRTFQALRIAVNRELDQLEALLGAAPDLVRPDGRVVWLSFHSLEDRLVKRALLDRTRWERLSPKPLSPSPTEQANNPRSRSAKLRAARRVADPGGGQDEG
jgi:16S rRNA (cytosine1402-N4)-methyltransferase